MRQAPEFMPFSDPLVQIEAGRPSGDNRPTLSSLRAVSIVQGAARAGRILFLDPAPLHGRQGIVRRSPTPSPSPGSKPEAESALLKHPAHNMRRFGVDVNLLPHRAQFFRR